ncbi:hypothetical protein ACFE04_005147 [Oxalis oulophora]
MDYILTPTLARLDELILSQDVKVLSGIEEHVKTLRIKLIRVQGLLKLVDDKFFSRLDKLFSLFSSIIDAAHEVEDVIEKYVVNKGSVEAGGAAINFIKRLASFSDEDETANKKIEAIIHRFNYILETSAIQVFNRRASDLVSSQHEESRSSSLQTEEQSRRGNKPPLIRHKLIGIDEKVERVVDSLLDVAKSLFVAICDHPGTGKTTVAKKVYHHTKVRCHFDYFAWVDIYIDAFVSEGDYYDHVLEEIQRGLISSMHEQRDDLVNYLMKAGQKDIMSKLDEILQGEKCLVVVEDKRNPSRALEELLGHILHPITGSKFLIISESESVTSANFAVHGLGGFTSEEAWQLLQAIISSVEECYDYDMQLKTLGRDIAQYLDGMPWATVVVGGVLAAKLCPNKWQKVYDNLVVCMTDHHDPLQGLFMLGYMDLPTWLKPFLFYLNQFPAGCEINVSKLVRIWIAESFISSRVPETAEEGETLEDLAENNLNELISRCLVLVGDREANLRVKTCRLPEIVRNLCSKYPNIWIDSDDPDLIIHQHIDISRFPTSYRADLRSLLFFQRDFHKHKLLRVLDLEAADFGEESLPKSIGELIHLRYLSLRHAKLSKIPSTIGNLRFLQTLDLLIEGKSVYIPDVIWKLNRLRHLFLPEVGDVKVKLRLDTLTNLRTLVNFPVRNCDVKDLYVMTKLRELSICDAMSIRNFARFSKLLSLRLKHLQKFSVHDKGREGDKGAEEEHEY